MNFSSVRYISGFWLCYLSLLIHYSVDAQDAAKKNSAQIYGIFNNTATLETRIIPIYNTKEIQQTMNAEGGFQIPDESNRQSSNEWYGSASLAADPRTGQFFYASKSGESPSLWMFSAEGTHVRINTMAKNIQGHCFTKMAMGPDGYVYAISTRLNRNNLSADKETLVVRFKPYSKPSSVKLEIIGFLSGKNGYRNALTYSGDMAFSSAGDLFLFGTELDTTLNYYKGAHIYKIASFDLQQGKKPATICIKHVGQIAGMGVKTGIDSTIITGVAFQPDGSFVLSAIDKYTGSRMHFYYGTFMDKTTMVSLLTMGYSIPPGFVISDLASFSYPKVAISQKNLPVKEKPVTKTQGNEWEKTVILTQLTY
jgi:hypothetical protein